jgi:4-hydroxythreonine-4-phosphate dehydrogenase
MARTPRIAFVMGDPAGIGTEIAARMLARPEVIDSAAILVIGDRRVLAAGERATGVTLDIPSVDRVEDAHPEPGHPVLLDLKNCDPEKLPRAEPSELGGAFSVATFRLALQLAKAGDVDGVFFTPFNKMAMNLAGCHHDDELYFAVDVLKHEGYFGHFLRVGDMWNSRVTSHVSIAQVPGLITFERVLDGIRASDRILREAGVTRPRIAVAALNPHAGEGGLFGREEIDVIAPAVEEAKRRQIGVEGPFPSDTVWLKARRGDFDIVLTMYHDQAQIALKLMGFERGVSILGGLPFPVSTPTHGTAYDIAGQGKADVMPSVLSFKVCRDMSAARIN